MGADDESDGSRSRSRGRDRDRDRGRDKDRRRSPSRSRSRDEGRDPSPTYSVEDLWRRLDHLGSWKGLGKMEKKRDTLTGAEKDDLRALERKMEKRLTAGYRSSCIRTSLTILEHGYNVKQDHMERQLAQCVQRPGVHQVAMCLKLLQIQRDSFIGIESFLRGLGVLVQRNAPVQVLRMWLNLGVPRGQKALRPLPHDYDDEEKGLAGQDLEDALGVITDDEEDEKGASRRTIYITDCRARPELNGRFEKSEDLTAFHRPVYEKIVTKKIDRKGKGGKAGKGFNAKELKQLLMPQMLTQEED